MNTENEKEHKVFLVSREYLEVTGVKEVESFTEKTVAAVSSRGVFSVEGGDLRIENFSGESGKLIVRGKIDGFFYYGDETDGKKKQKKPKIR